MVIQRSISYVTSPSGLGNRVIPMGNAISLASELNYRPVMFWTAVPELGGARFGDLFDTTDLPFGLVEKYKASILGITIFRNYEGQSYTTRAIFKILRPLIRLQYDRIIQPSAQERQRLMNKPATDLLAYRKILFSPSLRFGYGCDVNWLKPAPQIAHRVTELKQQFAPNTVGSHIRGTDLRHPIWGNKIPPVEKMITRMLAEIELDPNVKFFIASDGDKAEKRLFDLFEKKLIKMKSGARGTIEGQQDAVVDLFGLAMTSRIMGGRYSSFATLAALIGNKPLLRIHTPKFKPKDA